MTNLHQMMQGCFDPSRTGERVCVRHGGPEGNIHCIATDSERPANPMIGPSAKSPAVLRFPRLAARDLEGRAITLPDAFAGSSNLVVVAFRREQQSMVDSWISWFDTISKTHPGLRCYEVPVLATRWSPARRFIDGGMAQAVREQRRVVAR